MLGGGLWLITLGSSACYAIAGAAMLASPTGRQFPVVVAGGHGSLGTRLGDHVMAYALPRRL